MFVKRVSSRNKAGSYKIEENIWNAYSQQKISSENIIYKAFQIRKNSTQNKNGQKP